MVKTYLQWSRAAVLASLAAPVVVTLCTITLNQEVGRTPLWMVIALVLVAMMLAPIPVALTRYFFNKIEPLVDSHAEQQVEFLDKIQGKYLSFLILASSGLSLFLELVIIRWQASVFEFFAYYKNFSLLACFAGLGLGYAISHRSRIPMICTIPLLLWQLFYLTAMRFGLGYGACLSLLSMPFQEDQNLAFNTYQLTASNYIAIYFFLLTVFILTALAFVPIGQICGRLMSQMKPLPAYGLNLLGSLFGIVLILILSLYWTPPVVWFSVAFALAILFACYSNQAMLTAAMSCCAAFVVLGWPVTFGYERIYSPYQLLERGPGDHGVQKIRAAGQYYQRIMDLSPGSLISHPDLKEKAKYYDFAYKIARNLNDVAIVGAGAGNDIAAALRAGFQHVDAVELDPAIMKLGQMYHPEKPYESPKVNGIVDDARSFLRNSRGLYDLVVFALLDSHIGQESGLRVDSYVYTVEALKEARQRLKPDGVLSLAFAVTSPQREHKIYLMMKEAFDNHPPVSVYAKYDNAMIFLQSNKCDLVVSPTFLAENGFEDIGVDAAKPMDIDLPTDDWPFFYSPKRTFPLTYMPFYGMVLILCLGLFASLYKERPQLSTLPFLFLGAGFMLIETKAITELGLQFGNTWTINGIVIAALLLMAFLSNLFVQKLNIQQALIPFIFLFLSIAGGFAVTYMGGFPATAVGKTLAVFVLVCPIFFSGIVFSSLLKKHDDIASAMFMNLLGAILGGLLEYGATFLGYRALYLLAIAIYLVAMLFTLKKTSK